MNALKFVLKIWTAVIASWVFGGGAMVIGLYLLGGVDTSLSDIGITISQDTLIVLGLGSISSAFGGFIGFRYPFSMSGANSVSI